MCPSNIVVAWIFDCTADPEQSTPLALVGRPQYIEGFLGLTRKVSIPIEFGCSVVSGQIVYVATPGLWATARVRSMVVSLAGGGLHGPSEWMDILRDAIGEESWVPPMPMPASFVSKMSRTFVQAAAGHPRTP